MTKSKIGLGLLAPPTILSALALIGWILDIPLLKSGIVSGVYMNPATLLCFLFLCLETGRLIIENDSPIINRIGQWLTWIVIIAGASKLSDIMFGTGFGVDTLLFTSKLSLNSTQPHRMAPNTATCFLALGASLQLLRGRRVSIFLAQGLAASAMLTAVVAMTGYMYDVELLFGVGIFISMAFNTAVSFFFLSASVLYARRTQGFMRFFVSGAPSIQEPAPLQTKILSWFLLITILPLFINAFFNYQQAKVRFEEEVFEGLQGFADRQTLLIDNFVTERKADVSVFAQFPSVKGSFAKIEEAYLISGAGSTTYLEAAKEFQPIAQTILKYYDYKNILLVSSKGEVFFSAMPGKLFGTNLFTGITKDSELSRAVRTAQETKTTEISSLAFYPQLQAKVAMYIATPIIQDEKVIGLMVLRMSPDNVFLAIQSYKGLGETGEMVLATRIGDEAVFVAPTRHDPTAAFKFRTKIGSNLALPAHYAVEGGNGQGYSVDYRAQAVWAVWRYLPALKLGLVVKKDVREIDDQIKPIKYFSSLLTLLTTLFAAGVAARIAKSITQPIGELTKTARMIADGKLHERINIREQNEIGVLADSFNRMAVNLESSYAKVNAVVANAMDGIITIHADGKIDTFNPAAERIFGYKADELAGKNISLLMPEPYRSEHDSYLQNYLRTGQSKVIGIAREIPALRKNGEEFPLEISVSEIFSGNQRLFTGIVRDITERKTMETLQRENEAKLRAIINASPVPNALNDEQQNIAFLNPAFIETFGYTLEDIPTLKDWWLKAYPDPQYRQWVIDTWQANIETAKQENKPFQRLELNIQCADGTTKSVLAGASSIEKSFKGNHLVVLYDITDRKRTEEELKLHRSHLLELVDQKTRSLSEANATIVRALREEEAIYDTNPDILYVADTQARLIKWNNKMEEVSEYAPHELMNKECASFFPPEEMDLVSKAIQKVFSEGKGEVEAYFLTKSGARILYHFNGVQLKNEHDKIIGFTGTGRDISERKRAEETLRQTQKQLLHAEKLSSLGKLTGSIAHEFNNPLYGMRLLLEEIADEATLDEAHKNNLSLAIKECDRMANLVKQLQGFYKPSSQNKVETSINQLVEEMLLLTLKKMKGKNIVLEKNLDPGLPKVKVVEDQIKQVVLNIIQNAEESIPVGRTDGKITVTTQNRGNEILIRIQDNGTGIAEEISSKIFEPFFTTKSAVKGTGLGLSVSHGIIESHDGKIQVDSKPEEGTIFTLTLPKI